MIKIVQYSIQARLIQRDRPSLLPPTLQVKNCAMGDIASESNFTNLRDFEL